MCQGIRPFSLGKSSHTSATYNAAESFSTIFEVEIFQQKGEAESATIRGIFALLFFCDKVWFCFVKCKTRGFAGACFVYYWQNCALSMPSAPTPEGAEGKNPEAWPFFCFCCNLVTQLLKNFLGDFSSFFARLSVSEHFEKFAKVPCIFWLQKTEFRDCNLLLDLNFFLLVEKAPIHLLFLRDPKVSEGLRKEELILCSMYKNLLEVCFSCKKYHERFLLRTRNLPQGLVTV